jgi:PucR C-terminal helix-turn-helix domain
VHRHTLRYRMRKVADLLCRNLDSADTRMELWAAVEILANQSAADYRESRPRRQEWHGKQPHRRTAGSETSRRRIS